MDRGLAGMKFSGSVNRYGVNSTTVASIVSASK